MKRIFIIGLLLLCLVPLIAARKALVIGNASYEQGELRNPLNDSRDVARSLQELGFLVSAYENLNRAGFYNAVGSFVSALVPSDEAVFFYSGHAVQIDGTNYLIPVNEFIDSSTRCAFLSYNCSMLLEELSRAGISIVILDACRDNPFSFTRSLNKGLASMKAAAGTQYVIFSTEEGKTAADGEGRNSPFTESLLSNINKPDKKITDLMQTVSNEVAIKTQERQIPYGTGILRQDFYFNRGSEVSTSPVILPLTTNATVETVAKPKASGSGSIKIISKFGGDLYLDGDFNQSLFSGASATWEDIPVGLHTVELKSPKGDQTRKVNVIKSQTSLLDFDTADTFVEELLPEPESPRQENKKKEISIKPARAPLAPIKSLLAGGSGSLEIVSPLSGELYLGGRLIGSVEANKSKRFNKLDAGDFTLELFGQFSGHHQEVRISDKGITRVTIMDSEIQNYSGDMLFVPAGTYFMGTQFLDRSDYERPRHEVTLPPFLLGFSEVTQEQWTEIMGSNPSVRTGDKLPVTNVSWYEAVEFCNALSLRDGFEPVYKINKGFPDANNASDFDTLRYSVNCNWQASGYRLPTEAEWEYAARCGDSSNSLQFSGAISADGVAWYQDNSEGKVHETATKEPNNWGFFDLSGNVSEWCWDYWGSYFKEKQIHPKGTISGAFRVARGGSWMSESDACSCTARGGFAPHTQSKELGFRLARNARVY